MYIIDRENNSMSKVNRKTFRELRYRERDHLQEWIAKNPSSLGEDLLIIQKEFNGFSETNERLDLLALDKDGNIVVIENKLDDSGRDVVWQALKYVSYCASLSKEEILSIYDEYLKIQGIEISAKESLEEFFDGKDYDEVVLNEGISQRMILVASNFRKEVTSTVMWLIDNGIDIRCIKVTPYVLNENHLLTMEQVIPTKDSEDYIIRMSEKTQKDDESIKELRELEKTRLEFWGRLLQEYKLKKGNNSLFSNISPGPGSWISTGAGISHIAYHYDSTNNYSSVSLKLSDPDKDTNKMYFDRIYEYKDLIEEKYGEKMSWNRNDDLKYSTIIASRINIGINDRKQWDLLIPKMIDDMEKLKDSMSDVINKIRY